VFLVCETKFTVGKSKVIVFIAGKRSFGGGGDSTLWGIFPQEVPR